MARRRVPGRISVPAGLLALALAGCTPESAGSGPGAGSGGASASGSGGATGAGTGGRAGGGTGGGAGPGSGGAGGATGAGTGGNPGGGSGGAAVSGSGGGGGAGGATGDGLQKGSMCFAVCGFPAITDPDGDGYGWERQMTCLVATSAAAAGTTPCIAPTPMNPPTPGNGILGGTTCFSVCSSPITDDDGDGFGYEHLNPCIVAGTAPALGGLPCVPTTMPLGTGDGIRVSDGTCHPLCVNLATAMPDAAGWGYENMRTCVVSTSVAALQGVPCDAPDPPTPPPPPPAPPGTGWNADYTATMFGQADCAQHGFTDPTNLNASTCVSRGAVTLGGSNTMFFGATGDLATLWNGAPQCTCTSGGQTQGRCSSPPACSGQTNCGQCVEVVCNGTGTHSYMNDGYTHNEFCKPRTSVVVQLIDACPHNHPSNTYWCTTARPQHIDVSCSAFNSIVQGRPVGEIGSINVYARSVNCNVGLGVKTF